MGYRNQEKGDMSRTTMTVTNDLKARLNELGGGSFEDIIREELELPSREEVEGSG